MCSIETSDSIAATEEMTKAATTVLEYIDACRKMGGSIDIADFAMDVYRVLGPSIQNIDASRFSDLSQAILDILITIERAAVEAKNYKPLPENPAEFESWIADTLRPHVRKKRAELAPTVWQAPSST